MVPQGQAAKEVEINGVRLQYIEQGSGEPIVFVHGAPHDLRAWEPVREDIAKRYRFIAYTQRYFGTKPWPDEGKNYSIATHADDLAKFITSLNAGPVHLVGWSHGGVVAATAAISDPSLVRSLILYEAGMLSVLPAESPEGKIAREDRARMFGPVVAAASETGDFIKAAKLLQEVVFQLPARRIQQLAGGFADGAARQRSGCPADVRSSTASRHHMRHTEGFHPAGGPDSSRSKDRFETTYSISPRVMPISMSSQSFRRYNSARSLCRLRRSLRRS